MTILLAGDIGATKTILRLVESQATSGDRQLPNQTTLHEQTYPSQEFADLVPMVGKFLGEAQQQGSQITPEKACFGIAGPVVNNTSKLTNLNWNLEASRLERELQVAQVALINDFVAVGYGVLGLSEEDLHTLQPGTPNTDAPIAVIGAGTGLGQGFVIPQSGSYRVFATEGGHSSFAPRTQLEFDLLQYILEKNNINRVSVERVVSGIGIVAIYQFLRDRKIYPESSSLAEVYKTWEREIGQAEKSVNLAGEISKAAINKQDALAQKTMEIFIEAYGAEAGDVALKFLPYGGLYIAGGIAAKNLPLMQQGNFLQAFLSKGRMHSLLEQVPIHIVLNPQVGLIGSALRAAQ
ncbi:glucokinase [Aliterella atlantica]|uniref:Glucokinase n=1 Tax=Aliterella atlantica CENA595 TaxID=1618023 RepID=A0A0D8ZQM0_9CYAN|nr:glucokinase [Aliterella atlantica]KJH71030.1 glucokinase [Aliterella atlantica CENA595]